MSRKDVTVWHIKDKKLEMEIEPGANLKYPHGKPQEYTKTKTNAGNIYNFAGTHEVKSINTLNGRTNGYFEPNPAEIHKYAKKEPRPSTPSFNTGTNNNNPTRNKECKKGSCPIMGGRRRTRRAKSRRAKSRRARRS